MVWFSSSTLVLMVRAATEEVWATQASATQLASSLTLSTTLNQSTPMATTSVLTSTATSSPLLRLTSHHLSTTDRPTMLGSITMANSNCSRYASPAHLSDRFSRTLLFSSTCRPFLDRLTATWDSLLLLVDLGSDTLSSHGGSLTRTRLALFVEMELSSLEKAAMEEYAAHLIANSPHGRLLATTQADLAKPQRSATVGPPLALRVLTMGLPQSAEMPLDLAMLQNTALVFLRLALPTLSRLPEQFVETQPPHVTSPLRALATTLLALRILWRLPVLLAKKPLEIVCLLATVPRLNARSPIAKLLAILR